MGIRPRHLVGLALVGLVALMACKRVKSLGRSADPTCGMSPSDWCDSVSGDPCASHPNSKECEADPRCEAYPYRGESAVGCMTNARCFASNCPEVGCISRCEVLDHDACARDEPCLWQGQGGDCKRGDRRCIWDGVTCARTRSCIHGYPTPPSARSGP